jgi:hypothetical protein
VNAVRVKRLVNLLVTRNPLGLENSPRRFLKPLIVDHARTVAGARTYALPWGNQTLAWAAREIGRYS